MKILALEIEVNGIRDEQFTMELLVEEATTYMGIISRRHHSRIILLSG